MNWAKELLKSAPTKKSDAELKMEDALRCYEQKFGKPFPIGYGSASYDSFEATTVAVEKCIKTGRPAKEPSYTNNCKY